MQNQIENIIHIAYVMHDKKGDYGKYETASIYSVLSNTTHQIHLHILTDKTLREDVKKEIQKIAKSYDAFVSFYNVMLNTRFYKLPSIEVFSIGTLYRLYIDKFIKASKVIYLDGDTIVNLDISNLWNTDMQGKIIMACQDEGFKKHWAKYSCFDNGIFQRDTYFNAGVFVLDLCKYRKEYKSLEHEGINFFDQYPDCKYLDQDVMNYIFKNKIKFLPRKYNAYIAGERTDSLYKINEYIYHCASENGRIKYYKRDIYDDLFWNYYKQTKWGQGQELEKFYHDKLVSKQDLNRWTLDAYRKISSGKKVFWGTSGELHDVIKSKFEIDIHHDIYVDNNEKMWGKTKDKMQIYAPSQLKDFGADFSIIILSKSYIPICRQLLSLGYTENVDFFDGRKFLEEKEGGYPEWNVL